MITANVHQAKTQLSKLIERAEAGEEVVIARNGKPAVRLTPVAPPLQISGALKGEIGVGPDYTSSAARIAAGSVPSRRRDVVGCMHTEASSLSAEAWRRLSAAVAAEMSDTAKFDVELEDSLEFIPATRP